MGGRKGKTWPSFTIELDLDGPGTGVEGGSGEGHEASRARLVPSCGGIAVAVGVEIKSPTILDACGCGDSGSNVTCGPEVTAERGGGESGNGADRGGVVLNRIVRACTRRGGRERR